MTLETISKYTEDSIAQCKELLKFIQKLQQLESEYAAGLYKLTSKDSTKSKGRWFKSESELALNSSSVEMLSTKSVVWAMFEKMRETYCTIASSHKAMSTKIQENIMNRLSIAVRDMELRRKQIIDDGTKSSKELVEATLNLKKAKQFFEDAQNAVAEASSASQKLTYQATVRGKDFEKINAKLVTANEKAVVAQEAYAQSEKYCRHVQDMWYSQLLPNIMQRFIGEEQDRLIQSLEAMEQLCHIQKMTCESASLQLTTLEDQITSTNMSDDIQILEEEYLLVQPQDGNAVSVQSLKENTTLATRLWFRLGNITESWRTRFCILVEKDMKIYIFEHEDSLKVKEIIDLKISSYRPIHDSLLNANYGFQIVTQDKEKNMTIYCFATDSLKDKVDWSEKLRCYLFAVREASSDNLGSGSLITDDQPQVFRSVKLGVTEARDLPMSDVVRRTVDCFALVEFDVPVAKTLTGYSTANPFWGDQFNFNEVPYSVKYIRLRLCAKRSLQKEVEIGFIVIDLRKPEIKNDEWVELIMSENFTLGPNDPKPAIRISLSNRCYCTLPKSDYEPFYDLLISDINLLNIFNKITTNRNDDARNLISLLAMRDSELTVINNLVEYELSQTDDPNIIFRGNSLATKVVDFYMKLKGTKYLKDTLGELVCMVYNSKDHIEIDQLKLDRPEDVPKNIKKLNSLVISFWDAICRSTDQIPKELCTVFSFIKDTAAKKFPSNPNIKYLSVTGFLYLRFFCPAILNPKLFNLAATHPDPHSGRTLTLVAKVLQNLANLADFQAKEPHMIPMNEFIKRNMEVLKGTIDSMCMLKDLHTRDNSPIESVYVKDIESVLVVFEENFEMVNQTFGEMDPSALAVKNIINSLQRKRASIPMFAPILTSRLVKKIDRSNSSRISSPALSEVRTSTPKQKPSQLSTNILTRNDSDLPVVPPINTTPKIELSSLSNEGEASPVFSDTIQRVFQGADLNNFINEAKSPTDDKDISELGELDKDKDGSKNSELDRDQGSTKVNDLDKERESSKALARHQSESSKFKFKEPIALNDTDIKRRKSTELISTKSLIDDDFLKKSVLREKLTIDMFDNLFQTKNEEHDVTPYKATKSADDLLPKLHDDHSESRGSKEVKKNRSRPKGMVTVEENEAFLVKKMTKSTSRERLNAHAGEFDPNDLKDLQAVVSNYEAQEASGENEASEGNGTDAESSENESKAGRQRSSSNVKKLIGEFNKHGPISMSGSPKKLSPNK